jgi:hypothetical protein
LSAGSRSRALAAAISVALLLAACSGTGTIPPSQATASSASASLPDILPVEGFEMAAGTYATTFQPRMMLTLPDRVWGNDEDLPNFLVLYSQGTDRDKTNRCTLIFLSPPKVYAPGSSGPLDPTPPSLVEWLRNHPYLHVLKETPVTVGGLAAVAVDLVAVPGKPYSDNCFGTPCKWLFPAGGVPPVGISSGYRGRIIVLTVNGTQVAILPESQPQVDPHCDFGVFGPQQATLLDSLRFVPQ